MGELHATAFDTVAALWAALLVAVVPPAAAQHVTLTDQEIQSRVEHELSEMDLGGATVDVTVRDAVVTVTGSVPSAWVKNEIVEEVQDVSDVRSVINNLTVPAGESDDVMGRDIARKIRRYVFYSIYDHVALRVDRGAVTLTGRVTAPYKAEEIADLASRTSGVTEVRNEIGALPASGFDDQIRASIASRIYRSPLFLNYAIQPDPPIHIIVENGRVMLTGVVNSEVERRQAEILARGTFGVLGVSNDLRLEGSSETKPGS